MPRHKNKALKILHIIVSNLINALMINMKWTIINEIFTALYEEDFLVCLFNEILFKAALIWYL